MSRCHLIQFTEEEKRPSPGVSALGLPSHQIVKDYSQFNHQVVRATYTGTTPEGRQGFVELVRGRRVRPAYTFELDSSINEMNPLIRVGDRVGIPRKYFDRMTQNAPDLLAENVNYWFKKQNEVRLIRTLDGRGRAFLSDRYRSMDYADMMEAVLPILGENKVEVVSSQITDHRLYVQAKYPALEGVIQNSKQKGDVVQAGIVISNSEVGCGALKVETMIWRLVCTNGLVMSQAIRKYHVGRGGNGNGEDEAEEVFADDTRRADDRALWMKIRDVVKASLRKDVFDKNLSKINDATTGAKMLAPTKVIEEVAKRYGYGDDTRNGILAHLIEGGDLSKWGLVNAITRSAQDHEWDHGVEMERQASEVLELPKSGWDVLASMN